MDHAGAFGHADDAAAFAAERERRLRHFRADVGGEDGVRERVDAAGGETGDGVGERLAQLLIGKHDADHAGRGDEDFLVAAREQFGGARTNAFRGVVARLFR